MWCNLDKLALKRNDVKKHTWMLSHCYRKVTSQFINMEYDQKIVFCLFMENIFTNNLLAKLTMVPNDQDTTVDLN